MEILFAGVLVAALAIAFAAQSFLRPQHRTSIIFAAAAVPSLSLTLLAAIAATAEEGQSWFRIVVALAFWLCVFMFTGLFGAILGSELASLTKWLLRRQR